MDDTGRCVVLLFTLMMAPLDANQNGFIGMNTKYIIVEPFLKIICNQRMMTCRIRQFSSLFSLHVHGFMSITGMCERDSFSP